MADTNAFLVDPIDGLLFGVNDVATSGVVDSPGFMLPDPDWSFGQNGVASSGVIDSAGFFLPDPILLFGINGLAKVVSSDSPAFLLDLIAFPKSIGDDTFLIDFNSNTVPAFPGNTHMTEIIYPVVPISEQNKVLFQVDNEDWRVTTKAAPARTRESDTIRFRVDTSYLPTFLGDLYSNKLNQFRLTTPGYTPFGGTSEDNYVRMLSHGRPQREEKGLTQLIDVTFLFIATYP